MKIAIVGRGTAGCMSAAFFLANYPEAEIYWYYDSSVPTQSVGEGSTISLPVELFQNLNLDHTDLAKLYGTQKTGIFKTGWGTGNEFLHSFPLPNVGMHFSAVALQNYIFDRLKNNVKSFDGSIDHSSIDCDYIMDCSGKPKDYDDFYRSEYIPVNSAHITQCSWDRPDFYHTLALARPYGWVFGIPLRNRCSIGYLFNRDINNLEEVKEDVKNVIKDYNLIPNGITNHLEFSNYYRKQNYTNKIAYNGNASFFLEPLEATSFAVAKSVYVNAAANWVDGTTLEYINNRYIELIKQVENIIMLHYFSGSKFDTEFWRFAKQRGEECIGKSIRSDGNFREILEQSYKKFDLFFRKEYGIWQAFSFKQNIANLGIENKIRELLCSANTLNG